MSFDTIRIKVVNTSANPLPAYATPSAAGMDVRAMLAAPMTVNPGKRAIVPTGLKVAIPDGYEMQLRPRSGLAFKNGITLLNTPGTIDADYRGEIGVIIANLGDEPFTINNGDRICQAVIAPVVHAVWEKCDTLDATGRAEGGFGHSGVK